MLLCIYLEQLKIVSGKSLVSRRKCAKAQKHPDTIQRSCRGVSCVTVPATGLLSSFSNQPRGKNEGRPIVASGKHAGFHFLYSFALQPGIFNRIEADARHAERFPKRFGKRFRKPFRKRFPPAVVREVSDDAEHETLLIEENLRRRVLTTSETARAVKRLYELRGIDREGGSPATVAGVQEIASEIGKSERATRRLRTLADLIPSLAAMLDAGEITQAVAYQLAQMDEEAVQVTQQAITNWGDDFSKNLTAKDFVKSSDFTPITCNQCNHLQPPPLLGFLLVYHLIHFAVACWPGW